MRKHLIVFSLILTIVLFNAGLATAVDYKYIGNMQSHVFHITSCYHARRIALKNKVFFATRQKPIELGFRACKTCEP